jgi:hypothetical protein
LLDPGLASGDTKPRGVAAFHANRTFHVLAIDTDVSPYDSARDGRRFLVLENAEHTTQPLTVIVNCPRC